MTQSDKPRKLHPSGTKAIEEAWCHEEPRGIEVIVLVKLSNGAEEYSHITIPWTFLRAALRRKDAP